MGRRVRIVRKFRRFRELPEGPAKERGGEGTGEIVPDGEDGTGDSRQREHRKMSGGEGGRKTTVLHADLDGDGRLLGTLETENLSRQETKGETAEIMEHHHKDDDERRGEDAFSIERDHDTEDGSDGQRRNGRHIGLYLFCKTPKPIIQHDADDDGENDDLRDAQQHAPSIDIDALTGIEEDEERREEGRKEGGNGRHSHGEGEVTFGQESNDIARSTTGTAADEDDTDGEFRGEVEKFAEPPRQRRHDDELRQAADDDVLRTGEDNAEVLELEIQAHSAHHDAEHPVDALRGNPRKGCRDKEGHCAHC